MERFFILILTALLLAVSCEKETEFPADKDGRIFVSAMLGTDGKDRISITVSQPALGEERHQNPPPHQSVSRGQESRYRNPEQICCIPADYPPLQ